MTYLLLVQCFIIPRKCTALMYKCWHSDIRINVSTTKSHCFCLRLFQFFRTYKDQSHRTDPVPWLPKQTLPPQHLHPVAAESRPRLCHQTWIWYNESGRGMQEWLCQNLRLLGGHWDPRYGRVSFPFVSLKYSFTQTNNLPAFFPLIFLQWHTVHVFRFGLKGTYYILYVRPSAGQMGPLHYLSNASCQNVTSFNMTVKSGSSWDEKLRMWLLFPKCKNNMQQPGLLQAEHVCMVKSLVAFLQGSNKNVSI